MSSKYHDALPSGTEITDRNRHIWLAMRNDPTFPFLGASEWAAAIGVGKYGTPISTYMRLIGQGDPVKENSRMRRGHYLQQFALKEYEIETGDWVSPPHGRHEVFFWGPQSHGLFTGCTLDAISAAGYYIEGKSHGWRIKDQYGEGEDQIPVEYYTQCQVGMGIAQLHGEPISEARLVATFDGEEKPRIFPITENPDDFDSVWDSLEQFAWHIKTRTQPPYSAPADEPLMKTLYKWDGPGKELPDELGFLLADTFPLIEAKQEHDRESRELDKRIVETKGRIKDFLRGSGLGTWNGWEVAVKVSDRKEYTVKAGQVATFKVKPPTTVKSFMEIDPNASAV